MAYQGGGPYGGNPYNPNQPGGYPGGYAPPPGPGGQPGGYPGGYGPGAGGQSGYNPNQSGYNPSQPGYNPNQPGGYSSGYTPPPGAFAPQNSSINPEVQKWFNLVDRDRSGKITADELKMALVNGKGENFSDNACKFMIAMFDSDGTGTIDINEFEKLYAYINQWLAVFKTYDSDQSGHIEEAELTKAFTTMGFRFSQSFIEFLMKKCSIGAQKQISVDQFIVLCVQIQRFTESFRARDTEKRGVITIDFEDFLKVAIGCTDCRV